MTRVIVIGAGLLGSSAAMELAVRGAEVTVVEAGRPGGGTSGSSFAWLNAQDKEPDWYFQLNLDGIAAYDRLRRDLGSDGWFHGGGDLAIGWGAEAPEVRAKAERHRAAGYRVELRERGDLDQLEPAIRLPGDAADVALAWYPDEAWIDAHALVGAMLDRAVRRGATVRPGTAVARVEADAGAGPGVVLGSGERLEADQVVVAAGPASEALVAACGGRLPMAPSPGLLAVTEPVAAHLRRIVHVAGSIAIRPDGGGRLMLAARGVDNALRPEMTALSPNGTELATLLSRAGAVLPGLVGAGVERARIGVRSVAADGKPAVGPVPGCPGVYTLVSHSGATLAALLGELVAADLISGDAARLGPCRLDRFAQA
jgi:glycine/D-amino acid oxidase-like deaminating enzyme